MFFVKALAIALLLCASLALQAETPSEAQVRDAVRELRQDPPLNGEVSSRTLEWVSDSEKKKEVTRNRSQWLRDFARWLEESMRLLAWLLAVVAVTWILWRLRGYLDVSRPSANAAVDHPSHVQTLDIRPESLPLDIGAHALALWQAGHTLAALSVLYRGALSRLVHQHGIAIRAASTEGDCVRLANAALPEVPARYFFDLVDCWRQTVYAGRNAPEDTVTRLCREFAVLDPPMVAEPARS